MYRTVGAEEGGSVTDVAQLNRAIGTLLGDARQATGLSQSQVARRLNVAQSRIAKLELGTRRLLYSEAIELAEIYRVDLTRFDPRSLAGSKPPRRPRVDQRVAARGPSR